MIYRCFKSGSLALFFFVLSFTYPIEIFSGQKKSISAVAQTPQLPKPSTENKKTNQSQTSEARFVDYFAQERLLQGHKGSVNDASFSPDGKYIVTAGSNGDARLWNISGKETRLVSTLQGHRGNVKTGNFSPDGKLIVTSSFDGTVRVWNLLGNELAVLKGDRGNVYSANFSPDGQRIVTAGADKTVRVWDVSGQQLKEITAHSGSVYSANFSPDGKQIVTASADKTARLWDISGKLIAELQGHTDTVWSANFSPDGKRIVTASDDKTARIWDVSGKLLAVLSGHNESVYSADFSTDGKRIVTASLDFTGLIWDAKGKLVGKLEQHTGGVNSAGFSLDGKWIVTASNDGTVRVWDINSKLMTELQGHQGMVNRATLSKDASLVFTSSLDNTVRVWDLSGKLLTQIQGLGNFTKSMNFSPDNKLFVAQPFMASKIVNLWDTSGELLEQLEHKNSVWSTSFSPDGQRIVTVSDENAYIWSKSGKLLAELKGHSGDIFNANFTLNGQRMVTSSADKTARVWDINSGKLIAKLEEHSGSVFNANFSPDGQRIVTASADGIVRIWDTDGKILKELKGSSGGVSSASFSPDGKLIVADSEGNTARVWNINGKLIAELKGYTRKINSVKFSSDGKYVFSAFNSNTVGIWDTNGRLLAELQGTQAINQKDIISSNGQLVITKFGNTARVWNLSEKTLNQLTLPETYSGYKSEPKKTNLNSYKVEADAIFSPDKRYILTLSPSGIVRMWDNSGKVLVEIKGCNGGINSFNVSSDGKQIITAENDGFACVWDINGKLLFKLKGNSRKVNNAQFSSDGKWIVASDEYDIITFVWDIKGRLLAKLEGGKAKFSPDSKLIITKSFDNFNIWNISGKLLAELRGDADFKDVSFSPDGQRIVTTSENDISRVWNTSGKFLAEFKGGKSTSFSPNGKLLATASGDGIIRIWDINGNLLHEFKENSKSIVFSSNGQQILTKSADGTARVWNIFGKLLLKLKGDADDVSSAKFSSDGQQIITASNNGAVHVWDKSGKLLLELKKNYSSVYSAKFSSDGQQVITISSNGNAYVWDTNGKLRTQFPGYIFISSDRKRILTASNDGTLNVWDTSGKLLAKLGHKIKPSNAEFSSDGKLILTASNGIVRIWDISGKLLEELEGADGSFSPDGKLIITGSNEGSYVRIWDISGKLIAKFLPTGDPFGIFADISPDGNLIVITELLGSSQGIRFLNRLGKQIAFIPGEIFLGFSSDNKLILTKTNSLLSRVVSSGVVRLRDRSSGKLIAELEKLYQSQAVIARFSPDMKWIITQYDNGTAGIWDFSGNLKAEFPGNEVLPSLNGVKISPDSKLIVTANNDKDSTARLWDISGKLIAKLQGHQGVIKSVDFSPDGQSIITASNDGTVRIWNTSGKQLAVLEIPQSPSSPKVQADRLRDLQFYAPNCDLAFKPWNKALRIYQDISDTRNQIVIHQQLGNAYYCISDYTNAIKSYNQASTIAQKFNYPQIQVRNRLNIGNVYATLADYQTAINKYNEALKLIPQENSQIKAEILQGKGDVYYSQGKYSEAIKNYSQALIIDKSINNTAGIANNKLKLADIYLKSGDVNKAIQFYKEASQIQSTEALSGLGNTYLFLGDTSKAINYYQQSLDKARQIADKEAEANALNKLANALRKLNKDKLPEAEKYLLAAIEIWENLRVNLEDVNKISIFEKQTRTYRLLQQILIAQNKIKEALEISERGRARAFVELLSKRLSPDNNEKSQIALPNINQIQKVAKAQNSTLVQYSIITDEFKINGKPQTKESLLYIWVVKPSGEISFRQTDLKPLWQNENTNLSELIKNTRLSIGAVDIRSRQAGGLIASGNNLNKEKQTKSLQRLHQLLINPIADLLPQNPSARVSFIPQGSLFLVPFPALQNKNGQYLIEKYTILTSPSIQVLDLTRKQKQKNSLTKLNSSNALVVGNPEMPSISLQPGEPAKKLPNLPGAETEAKAIAPMLNTKAITGSAATEAEIVQKMPQAQIIHLATHGLFDDLRGLGSALAFNTSPKDDGLLTAEEILDIKLNADLVVLSACDTGRGRITGDGVIGLSRSFISAGVPSIIVSLWSVDDDSTAFLMTEFYQNLQQGIDKATALRKAMLSAKEKYQNPLQWAAFTLIGEAE